MYVLRSLSPVGYFSDELGADRSVFGGVSIYISLDGDVEVSRYLFEEENQSLKLAINPFPYSREKKDIIIVIRVYYIIIHKRRKPGAHLKSNQISNPAEISRAIYMKTMSDGSKELSNLPILHTLVYFVSEYGYSLTLFMSPCLDPCPGPCARYPLLRMERDGMRSDAMWVCGWTD